MAGFHELGMVLRFYAMPGLPGEASERKVPASGERNQGPVTMTGRGLAVVVIGMMLAACASQKNSVMVVTSPYPSGQRHTEPVFYNGQQYEVSFTFNAIANVYDVTVSGNGGRPLGGTPGDRKVVEAITASAVRHFACPERQKGHIVANSTRHTGVAWELQARCG
jgi:hypothetical protein